MHPLLILSAGVVVWAVSRQVPQARALASAIRAAAREFQEQRQQKAPAPRQVDQGSPSQSVEPK